jgi:CheY-like chemotaxis protein
VTATTELENLGVRVQTAADADEALETLQEERHCALLLLAASASTEESCARISRINDEAAGSRPPVYVIGNLDEGQRARCQAAGADGFLAKPLDAAELADILQKVLAQAAPETGEAGARDIA